VRILDAVLLAAIQGVTEFFPVSSSGHLVLAQRLLHIDSGRALTFDIFVHFGTLLSILTVFWRDILVILRSLWTGVATYRLREQYRTSEPARIGIAIIVASIPAGVVGILFRQQIQEAFADPKLVSVGLVLTGLMLFLTRISVARMEKRVGILSGLVIGIAQAAAILPGISRSGATMSTAMYLRLTPQRAARFSFLMAVPVIAGSAVLEVPHLFGSESSSTLPSIIGAVVSAVVGYVAIRVLLRVIERGGVSVFAFYCFTVGVAGILFL
jgi:undecaprenyl-diphosphatase